MEYLGEWHSHPKGANAAASKDDRKVLTLLSEVMAEDARPAIMLIVGSARQDGTSEMVLAQEGRPHNP